MTLIEHQSGPEQVANEIAEFRKQNPVMYIQKKRELPGKDLGMVFLGG